MTSSADLLLAALLAAAPAPPALDGAVREAVAARWSVPAADVVLDWGAAGAVDPGARVERVLGGAGGWFTVALAGAPARRVRAAVEVEVPVAARALTAGEVVAASDVRRERRRVHGPATDLPSAALVGGEVRRALAPGERLGWPAVAPPAVIRAGEPVAVAWTRGGVEVRLEGVALQGARAGEPVRVRVPGRDRRLTGIAAAPGTVRLEGGLR